MLTSTLKIKDRHARLSKVFDEIMVLSFFPLKFVLMVNVQVTPHLPTLSKFGNCSNLILEKKFSSPTSVFMNTV